MAQWWSSYLVGRRAHWFIALLVAMLAIVMVPLVGAGASSSQGESATQGGSCGVQLARWWGPDRYATAIDVSRETYDGGANEVFIATGENFPDALAVSTLAFKLGGPVLLTRTGDLPGTTANEIRRLKAKNITILGGIAAVSVAVENSLRALGKVKRVWGADRYATAVEISKVSFPNSGAVSKVYVAVGTGFADAIGAAPVASIKNAPLLLTDGDSLATVTRQEILRLGPATVFVIGGGVSQFVMDRIAALGPNVVAVSGTDRYSTAISVSKHGFPSGAETVFISRGSTFPDALAGGVAAASANAPILLTPETALPVSIVNELKRLNPSRIVILGGPAAVSRFVADSMVAAVCGTPTPTTTIPGATTVPPTPNTTTTVPPTPTTTTTVPPTPTTTVPPTPTTTTTVPSTPTTTVPPPTTTTTVPPPTTTTTVPPPTTTTTTAPPPDTTIPVITVTGANPLTVRLNASFSDPGATASDNLDGDITASIVAVDPVDTSVAGEYTVTYDVTDAAGNAAIQKSRTVKVVVVQGIAQMNHFLTGYKGPDSDQANKLTVPATDPAGIAYHGPSGRLFIVDSEIAEPNLSTAFAASGGNVFETSLDGSTLYNVYDLSNDEPTGIAYDETDDVFYVTNDDANRLYRYTFTPDVGFILEDSISTAAEGYRDLEGVTVDGAGNIYVIVQIQKVILVFSYSNGFTLDRTMDLGALNPGKPVPTNPEGIAYDPDTGDLFVVAARDLPNALYRYTPSGIALERYDLGSFSPLPAFGTVQHNQTEVDTPQGLVFAPASSGTGTSLYIADGGVDNGVGTSPTDERDGVIYEAGFS